MGFSGILVVLLFAFAPVFLLVRYLKKEEGRRPAKSEVAGIVTCIVVMAACLVYVLHQRIFF